jgi:orotidine-5'-phosphate decarboxylase
MEPSQGHGYEARDKLIVALDMPFRAAMNLVEKIGDDVSTYKVGYQLFINAGTEVVYQLINAGKKVFLDLKLHDIPHTVEEGVKSAVDLDVDFLTVHAYPKTMEAAMKGKGSSKMRLIGVTVMTAYDDADVEAAGYRHKLIPLILERAERAQTLGLDGIVCSGDDLLSGRLGWYRGCLVTPGIRPKDFIADDQKRILTASEAVLAGSNYLVVGRPIITSPRPSVVTRALLEEISNAHSSQTN